MSWGIRHKIVTDDPFPIIPEQVTLTTFAHRRQQFVQINDKIYLQKKDAIQRKDGKWVFTLYEWKEDDE